MRRAYDRIGRPAPSVRPSAGQTGAVLLARISLAEALLLVVIIGVAVVAGLVALRGRRG